MALKGGGYQFAHVEFYGREGGRGKATKGEAKRSAKQIVGEAMREDGHIAHIDEPHPPTVLFGGTPQEAMEAGERWAKAQKGYRSTAPIMAAGVVSLPREREAEWPNFAADVVEWLKKKYGNRLVSVVEHTDEAHPHLHFYAVPEQGEAFGVVHGGYAARLEARRAKKPNGEVAAAYKAAMVEWQDEAFAGFGEKWGLGRVGPKRARMTRRKALEDRAEQTMADAEARATALAERERALEALEQAAQEREGRIVCNEAELTEAARGINHAGVALAAERVANLKIMRDLKVETMTAKSREAEAWDTVMEHGGTIVGKLQADNAKLSAEVAAKDAIIKALKTKIGYG